MGEAAPRGRDRRGGVGQIDIRLSAPARRAPCGDPARAGSGTTIETAARSGRDVQGLEAVSERTKPPYRADHVGSLLRPEALKKARAERAVGEISAEALKAVEDREIENVIRRQEEVGLEVDHRRRISSRVLELRFPRAARRRRIL